jgi:hypothetical protein
MPLAWIYNLPREDAEKLAIAFGVSVQGTLDELRKKLKKLRAVEKYLLPQSTRISLKWAWALRELMMLSFCVATFMLM